MSLLQRAATVVAMAVSIALSGQATAQQSAPTLTPAVVELADTNIVTPAPVPAVATDFDSLAEAVAAHQSSEADEATRCLAGAIYFESKGEPLAGQLAVAEVIINRAKSGRFPASVCAVVTQRGQFSFVRGGRIPAIDEGRAAYRTALAVARVAMADAWDGPAPKALYFNTPDRRPAARLTRIAMVGHHVFYR